MCSSVISIINVSVFCVLFVRKQPHPYVIYKETHHYANIVFPNHHWNRAYERHFVLWFSQTRKSVQTPPELWRIISQKKYRIDFIQICNTEVKVLQNIYVEFYFWYDLVY